MVKDKYLRIPSIPRHSMGHITTVKLSKKTRDKLAKLGNKKETYEDIVERLIKFYKKNSHKSRESRT